MEKIITWIKGHKTLIITCLFIMLVLKGCNSCSMERRYEYNLSAYEYKIDSMQSIIDERSIDTKDLCDTIHSLRTENSILKSVISDLKSDRDHYRKINKELVGVTDKLSKKDNTK
jgi:uncharacterized coiled-coil DUF342 family protein